MKTLRELMNSKSERTRLAAVLRASEILLEHQRGEERAAIAIERAAARKAEAKGTEQPETTAPTSMSHEDAVREAQEFLGRLSTKDTNAD